MKRVWAVLRTEGTKVQDLYGYKESQKDAIVLGMQLEFVSDILKGKGISIRPIDEDAIWSMGNLVMTRDLVFLDEQPQQRTEKK